MFTRRVKSLAEDEGADTWLAKALLPTLAPAGLGTGAPKSRLNRPPGSLELTAAGTAAAGAAGAANGSNGSAAAGAGAGAGVAAAAGGGRNAGAGAGVGAGAGAAAGAAADPKPNGSSLLAPPASSPPMLKGSNPSSPAAAGAAATSAQPHRATQSHTATATQPHQHGDTHTVTHSHSHSHIHTGDTHTATHTFVTWQLSARRTRQHAPEPPRPRGGVGPSDTNVLKSISFTLPDDARCLRRPPVGVALAGASCDAASTVA